MVRNVQCWKLFVFCAPKAQNDVTGTQNAHLYNLFLFFCLQDHVCG